MKEPAAKGVAPKENGCLQFIRVVIGDEIILPSGAKVFFWHLPMNRLQKVTNSVITAHSGNRL